MSIIRTLCIYVSKDVTIRGYCLKPKVFREQEVWETLAHTKTRLYRQTAVELVLKGCGNRALVKRVSSEQDLKKSPPPWCSASPQPPPGALCGPQAGCAVLSQPDQSLPVNYDPLQCCLTYLLRASCQLNLPILFSCPARLINPL